MLSNFGGNLGISKILKNFISGLISRVPGLPKSHWTSPLGPLDGCCGLGSLNGAKHSGEFFSQIRGQNMQSHRFAREHRNSTFQTTLNPNPLTALSPVNVWGVSKIKIFDEHP